MRRNRKVGTNMCFLIKISKKNFLLNILFNKKRICEMTENTGYKE